MQRQRAVRTTDELWTHVTDMAESQGLTVNKFVTLALERALTPAAAGGSVAPLPLAGEAKRSDRLAGRVTLKGPAAGYPYHPHEKNVKDTIASERWVEVYQLPFTVADLVAACYAAGVGDPWEGFIRSRLREQMNDALEDVGSRPAVLRARLRQIAGVA